MKSFILILSLVLVGCSSADKKPEITKENVTNDAFKKPKPLTNGQITDFYSVKTKALNPALQDETLDRHTTEEANSLVDSPDPLTVIAVKCSQGDFKSAFALAAKSFDKYQKIPSYWNQVANCHLNQGSNRKALLFYNKALEVSPNYVPVLNNIGVLYSRMGQPQKALVAFEKANKQSRFSKTPRYNLAKLYLHFGLADDALVLFEGLLSESPQDIDLLNAVASSYFISGNNQKAMTYYQRIPQQFWSSAEIGLNLALTLKGLNQKEDAYRIFNSISKPKKDELSAYYQTVKRQLGEKG